MAVLLDGPDSQDAPCRHDPWSHAKAGKFMYGFYVGSLYSSTGFAAGTLDLRRIRKQETKDRSLELREAT